jgi:hypothetical protein
VAGDDGDRTQWCEERNAALREVAGGSPAAGTCSLTTRFTPGDFANQPLLTATLLADVLRAQRDAGAS